MQTERRQRVRGAEPTLFEIRAIFHRLWGSQVGQKDYNKRDWCEFQGMMRKKFNVPL